MSCIIPSEISHSFLSLPLQLHYMKWFTNYKLNRYISKMKFFHAHFSHLRNIKWTYLQNLPAYWEKFQDDQQALRGSKSTHIDVKEPINLHYDGCSCMIINRIENYKVLYAQERRSRYLACIGRISDGLMGPQFPLASLHNVISLKQGRPHQLLYTHQQQWNQQT